MAVTSSAPRGLPSNSVEGYACVSLPLCLEPSGIRRLSAQLAPATVERRQDHTAPAAFASRAAGETIGYQRDRANFVSM